MPAKGRSIHILKRLYYALKIWTPLLNLLWWAFPSFCFSRANCGQGWTAWAIPWSTAWEIGGFVVKAQQIGA